MLQPARRDRRDASASRKHRAAANLQRQRNTMRKAAPGIVSAAETIIVAIHLDQASAPSRQVTWYIVRPTGNRTVHRSGAIMQPHS
jgi:hypothetical protein